MTSDTIDNLSRHAEIATANARLEEWKRLMKKGKTRSKTDEKRIRDLWNIITSNSIGL